MDNHNATSSIGRRDILKRSAVVAAAAWSTPMIMSSKVGASAGGTCDEPQCDYHYLIKVDVGGGCDDFFPNNAGFGAGSDQDCHAQYHQLLGANGISTVHTGGCGSVVSVLTATSTLLKIKVPPKFGVVFALRKQGQGCVGVCSPGEPECDSTGSTYTFSCGEYSNMILVVCGPVAYGSAINAYAAFPESTEAIGDTAVTEEPLEVESSRAPVAEESTTTTEAPAETTSTTEAPVETTTTTEAPVETTTTTTEAPVETTTTTQAPVEPLPTTTAEVTTEPVGAAEVPDPAVAEP